MAVRQLRELWIHTGTTCNLSCPFCHEAASPGDLRLQAPSLPALLPHLQAAITAGVERFAFTGGEPLIHRDIVAIVRTALQWRPCLILTNGTAPLIKRTQHLAQWLGQPHGLSFRVSIDYPDEAQHDADRGLRNFRKALQGLRLLHEAGFAVSIARLQQPDEDARAIANRFRNLLRRQQLPEDLPVIALPPLGGLGQPTLTQALSATATSLLCQRSRMLLQREQQVVYSPCPLVDDAPDMDMGCDLPAAWAADVPLRHARCTVCLKQDVPYANTEGETR